MDISLSKVEFDHASCSSEKLPLQRAVTKEDTFEQRYKQKSLRFFNFRSKFGARKNRQKNGTRQSIETNSSEKGNHCLTNIIQLLVI